MFGDEEKPSQYWYHNQEEMRKAYDIESPIDPFHKLDMPIVTINDQDYSNWTLFCPMKFTKTVTIHNMSTTKLCDQFSKKFMEVSLG